MRNPENKNPRETRPAKKRYTIPVRYQHLAAGLVMVVSLIVFFSPIIFEGKTFLGYDAVASLSWNPIVEKADADGTIPLWNPYIFCGMPAYSNLTFSVNHALYNVSSQVLALSSRLFQHLLGNPSLGYVLFYYLILGLGMYALTFSKVQNKIIALTVGLGSMYSLYVIIWIMISHITKIKTICWLPWIILVLERLRIRFSWRSLPLLILLFHFLYIPFHIQMMFYVFFMLGLYYLVLLLQAIKKQEAWKTVLRSAAVVLTAALLAVALNADRLMTMYEYSKHSIRGAASVLEQEQQEEPATDGGLDFAYATNWSFAPGELMTFIVPSWYGFGTHRYQRRPGTEPVSANTYWGPQPFVDGPQYMGIIILFFALIGFLQYRKDPFVIFLGLTVTISLLIAFGREFPVVYSLMFEYFPMFNRFRVPSMILILVQLSVPLLAAYGIASLNESGAGYYLQKEKRLKQLFWGVGIVFLLTLVGRGAVEVIHRSIFPIDDVGPKLAQSLKTDQPVAVAEFYDHVTSTVATDLSIALGLILLIIGSVWLHRKRKLALTSLLVLISVVAIADLWRVAVNPMEPVTQSYQESVFEAPGYIHFLHRDTTLYRTLTFIDGRPLKDNIHAYWNIENVFGYHPAKLRSYQDMVDAATLGNPLLLQLMNLKYIISNTVNTMTSRDTLLPVYDREDGKVAEFRIALPRAFFVKRWETASGPEILDKVAKLAFQPTDVAYSMEPLPMQIDPPQKGHKVEYNRYGLNGFELNVTATGTNLLFLSEVYYPAGWKATIDGQETPIYRLNYMFRGVVVPAGTHRVEMQFDPDPFRYGRNISFASNMMLLGGFLLAGLLLWKKRTTGQ